MVKSLVLSLTLFAGIANAESFEVCTPEGPCALRVTDTETGDDVWLVTENNTGLSIIWDGIYWLVSEEDYKAVRQMIPERLTLPAVNPTTGATLYEKGSSKPAPTPPPAGPLVSGSVTVTVGSSPCADCHTGNMKEIHKKVMDRK